MLSVIKGRCWPGSACGINVDDQRLCQVPLNLIIGQTRPKAGRHETPFQFREADCLHSL